MSDLFDKKIEENKNRIFENKKELEEYKREEERLLKEKEEFELSKALDKRELREKKERENRFLNEEDGLFSSFEVLIPDSRPSILEEMERGPENGHTKHGKEAWRQHIEHELHREEILDEARAHQAEVLNIYVNNNEHTKEKLSKVKEVTSLTEYKGMFLEEIDYNGLSFEKLCKDLSKEAEGNSKVNSLLKASEFTKKVLDFGKGPMDTPESKEMLKALLEEYRENFLDDEGLNDECLEDIEDTIPEMSFVFMFTGMAMHLSTLTNRLQRGTINDKDAERIKALSHQTYAIVSKVYLSKAYYEAVVQKKNEELKLKQKDLFLKRLEKTEENKKLNKENENLKEEKERLEEARIKKEQAKKAKSQEKKEVKKETGAEAMTAKERISIKQEIRKGVVDKKKKGKEAFNKLFSKESELKPLISKSVSPLCAKLDPKVVEKIKKTTFKELSQKRTKAAETIDRRFPELMGFERDIFVEFLISDENFKNYVEKTENTYESAGFYEEALEYLQSKLSEAYFEKVYEKESELSREDFEKNLHELTYFAITTDKAMFSVTALYDEKEVASEKYKKITFEYTQRKQKLNEFCLLKNELSKNPVFVDRYKEAEEYLRYLFFYGDKEKFDEEIKKYTVVAKNEIRLISIINELYKGNDKLTVGFLDYLGSRIYGGKLIFEKTLKALVNQAISENEVLGFIENSEDIFSSAGPESLKAHEAKAHGEMDRTGFKASLEKKLTGKQKKLLDTYSAEEVAILAMVTNMTELSGENPYEPGMEFVKEKSEWRKERSLARASIENYIKGGEFVYPVNYQKAFERLNASKLSDSISSEEALFLRAHQFVTLVRDAKEKLSNKKEDKEDLLEKQKKEKHLLWLRSAAGEEMILKSGNNEAVSLLEKTKREASSKKKNVFGLSEKSMRTLLKREAKKDKQAAILAGIEALSDRQRQLFYLALERRDCLDISKKDIMLNRFGLRDREFVNEEGRDELIESYFEGKEEKVDFDKVFLGILSSQIDDTYDEQGKSKSIPFSQRSTAVDWKLVLRALQLVRRADMEKELRDDERILYEEFADKEIVGEFKQDTGAVRRNIHNSGTRATRYLGRRIKEVVKDNLGPGFTLLVTSLMPEEIKGGIEQFSSQKPIEILGQISDAKETFESGKEMLDSFKNLYKVEKAKKGSATYKKEDEKAVEEMEKRLSGEVKEDIKGAMQRNKKKVELGAGEASARNVDTILEKMGDFLGTPSEKIINDFVGPIILGEAIHMINFIRGYVHDLMNISKSYNIEEASGKFKETLKKEKMDEKLVGKTTLQRMNFYCTANGFQNLTELGEFTGLSIVQSLLFSASGFNNAQKNMKLLAQVVMCAVGKRELIGSVSKEAAESLFSAIMGEDR